MANSKYVLGMDIGGTNVRMGLIDDAYTLHRFTRVSTENVFTNDQPGKGLSSIINNYLQENDAKEDVTSISIGFPSTLDKERKTILSTPNIPILQNIPIVNLISEEIDLPIYINRDVNLLMFYDLHTQKIPTKGTTIGYYFGTGVGNVILINGEILNGRNGVAAELGHIPILNDTTRCNCGNIGCLENYSSGKYLVELAESEFPDTPINRVFAEHASHPKISQFIGYRLCQGLFYSGRCPCRTLRHHPSLCSIGRNYGQGLQYRSSTSQGHQCGTGKTTSVERGRPTTFRS